MTKNYLGIDIGGTAVKIGLVTETGTILASNQYDVGFDCYQTPIIDTVLTKIDDFLDSISIDASSLAGIGVSATGQIDISTGVVIGSAGHLPNWLGTPIATLLSNKYGKPVTVANDANCALLGEHWIGCAKGHQNVIMITVGTGVGGGIITNGLILTGALGIAGELGHLSIKKDGLLCDCGNNGCFEKYASTTAFVSLVRDYLAKQDSPFLNHELNGKYIFEELLPHDTTIQTILMHWIEDIATGLIGLIHIFNPEMVVIGGGISNQTELFIKPLCHIIHQKVMPCFNQNLDIRSATLGNQAGILGAVANLLSQQKRG